MNDSISSFKVGSQDFAFSWSFLRSGQKNTKITRWMGSIFCGVKNNQQTNIKASTKFSHPFSRWWQLKYFWMSTPKIGGFHSLQLDGRHSFLQMGKWVGSIQPPNWCFVSHFFCCGWNFGQKTRYTPQRWEAVSSRIMKVILLSWRPLLMRAGIVSSRLGQGCYPRMKKWRMKKWRNVAKMTWAMLILKVLLQYFQGCFMILYVIYWGCDCVFPCYKRIGMDQQCNYARLARLAHHYCRCYAVIPNKHTSSECLFFVFDGEFHVFGPATLF